VYNINKYGGILFIMVNGSKISHSSFYCDNAVSYGQRMTTLIRQYWRILILQDTLILADECGHSLSIRNSVVTIKRWIEILLPLTIIITAPLRVECSQRFILFKSKRHFIYIFITPIQPTSFHTFLNTIQYSYFPEKKKMNMKCQHTLLSS